MADPMRIRAAVADGETTVRVLMSHIMEPGTRRDAAGALIPGHFITNVDCTHNGKTVLQAQFTGAVAQNPFLSFKFKGGAKGDKIVVKWSDNKGDSRTDEAVVA